MAEKLGYSNTSDAIKRHCRSIVKHDTPHPQSKTKTIEVNFINEGDLYRLICHSKLPNAEKFESWVMDEVLPQIRQTGGYIQVSEEEDDEQFLARALVVAQKTLEKKAIIIKQQKEKLEYQEPLVQLALKRLDKDGLISITDANKTFELKRGVMTRWAKDMGYIHKTQTEVNEKGEKYFKVYDNGGYKAIGVTEGGIRLINDSLDEIIHN